MQYTIPPDFRHEPGSLASSWSIPLDIFENIWKDQIGSLRVAILDTGAVKHDFLPDPVETKSFTGEPWQDGHSHGTHCSGTAVGRGDIGVYRTGNLIIGKVLSNQGSGSSAGIAAGIRWAADAKADVISMSLGGGGSDSVTNNAIDYAWSKNCYVVAAAGNDGYQGSNTIGWPAKYGNCLCCAATSTLEGAIASFSSGGSEIDFSCPGQAIVSASNAGGSQTRVMSGTSMSTPYSAGVLAYIKEKQLRAGAALWGSADEARAFFTAYCKDVGAPGKDVRHGAGLLDLIRFMEQLSFNEIDLI